MVKSAFEKVAGPFAGGMGGLAWDGSGLLFTLPGAMLIKRLDLSSGAVTDWRKYTGRVQALAFDTDGSAYAAQEGGRRIIRYHSDGTATPTALRIDGKVHNQPVDLVLDAQHRIWFADPYGEQSSIGPQIFPYLDHASVLRIEHDGRHQWVLRRMTFDTASPRAVLLSPDGRTLYVAEGDLRRTATRELRAYPVRADGQLGDYELLHVFGRDRRGPHRGIEGMALAEDGSIVACAGSHEAGPGPMLYVFSPQGQLVAGHVFPGAAPLRCAFAGPALDELYVSSADGHLYRTRVAGLRGSPSRQPAPTARIAG